MMWYPTTTHNHLGVNVEVWMIRGQEFLEELMWIIRGQPYAPAHGFGDCVVILTPAPWRTPAHGFYTCVEIHAPPPWSTPAHGFCDCVKSMRHPPGARRRMGFMIVL